MPDDQLLLRAAYLYYRRGMTQQEVAERVGAGRVKVSRLLAEALERGIVRIDIHHPLARLAEVEYELQERYGLADVVVASTPSGGDEDAADLALQSVASAAASYLAELEPAPGQLGISWGRTMSALAAAMPEGWASGVEVVQLNGAISRSQTPTRADYIAARLAETSNGHAQLLAAPAIVERAQLREALERDRSIAGTLERARRAEVAIFSLGALSRESVLVQSGYLDAGDVRRLEEAGCVGDLLSRFIDVEGRICDPQLDARTIGLPLAELPGKRRAIGVAAGAEKTGITRGALAGGYVNALVVDEQLALELLRDGDVDSGAAAS